MSDTSHPSEITSARKISPETLALIATEWFKAWRRAMLLAQETAPGRIERERAMLTYSGRRVREALAEHGISLEDYVGQQYSPSLPAEPVNPEDFDTEEGLVVDKTVEPTVLQDGRIIMRGKVVLAKGQ